MFYDLVISKDDKSISISIWNDNHEKLIRMFTKEVRDENNVFKIKVEDEIITIEEVRIRDELVSLSCFTSTIRANNFCINIY